MKEFSLRVIPLFLFFIIEWALIQKRYVLFLILAVPLVTWFWYLTKKQIYRKPKLSLIKKLMGNISYQIVSPWVTFFLVLFALIQLEFMYNNVSDVIYEANWCSIVYFIVNLVSLYLSTWLYPYVGREKMKNRSLLVSAISISYNQEEQKYEINIRNVELLTKPLDAPLCSGVKKIVLIPSDNVLEILSKEDIRDFKAYLINILKNEINNLNNEVKEEESVEKNKKRIKVERYEKRIKFLEDNVDVVVLDKRLDYNNYENCVNTIDEILKEQETDCGHNNTFLYLSPGTACVTAAFSLFTLSGRLPIYAPQGCDDITVFDVQPEGINGIKAALLTNDID